MRGCDILFLITGTMLRLFDNVIEKRISIIIKIMGKIILYRAKYFNCYEVLCFMGILNEKKKQ